MKIGMIGLGRMGANMTQRLLNGGHEVVVYDRDPAQVTTLVDKGAIGAKSLDDMIAQLPAPRAIWLMLPAAVVESTVTDLAARLKADDTLIDGGNSYYIDDIRRAGALKNAGIHYIDIGTSGGVWGLDRGYCLMIGGETAPVTRLNPIFATLAPARDSVAPTPGSESMKSTAPHGYLHCGGAGAGHFVKMVHNGIEYGLMAAYAEGFNILHHAGIGREAVQADAETTPLRDPEHFQYDLKLDEIAELWRRGSVIGSWLLDLTATALADEPDLKSFAGRVSDSGEGRWTLRAAIDTATPAPVLSAALNQRFASRGESLFADKMLSAMRSAFGGHHERGSK